MLYLFSKAYKAFISNLWLAKSSHDTLCSLPLIIVSKEYYSYLENSCCLLSHSAPFTPENQSRGGE